MEMKTKVCNPANYGGIRSQTRYIVIHWTSNEGDTAKNNVDYFAREALSPPSSAHYFVDENEVWSSVPADRIAWHCGAKSYKHPECRNTNSIGVEMCLTGKGMVLRRGTIERTVRLVRELMERYHVPLARVVQHYDVTGKHCPGPFVDSPTLWDDFKAALAAEQDDVFFPVGPGTEEEEEMKVYQYVPDMPEWAQDTFTRLVQAGFVAQNEKGELNVQESSLQPMVYLDRLLGGKLEKLPELLAEK